MEIDNLKALALFRGMTEIEIAAALEALQAVEKRFEKDEAILTAGSITERMGVVIGGSVRVESCDMWGNRTILSHVDAGGSFAESYALLDGEPMLVDVVANESCRVLSLRIGGLESLPGDISPWRVKLTGNLLNISAHKNLHLSGRGFHTSPKSIRGRVMAYLNTVSIQKRLSEFDIPFDRQQLADYLNVERTALSKELGKMQRDGILEVNKSHFKIKQ